MGDLLQTVQLDPTSLLSDPGLGEAAGGSAPPSRRSSAASQASDAGLRAAGPLAALQGMAIELERGGAVIAQYWGAAGCLLGFAAFACSAAGALISLALLFGEWPALSMRTGLFTLFALFCALALLRLAEKSSGAAGRAAAGQLSARMARGLTQVLNAGGTDPALVETWARTVLHQITLVISPEPELFIVKL